MKNHILGVLYTTVNNNATGVIMIQKLLEKRLIGCANIFPKITSIYIWNGQIQNNEEVVIILKTTKDLIFKLTEELKCIHPYETPCIMELEVSSVNQGYLDWIIKETSK
jgi:periplasmic divalent cation tolerance protein